MAATFSVRSFSPLAGLYLFPFQGETISEAVENAKYLRLAGCPADVVDEATGLPVPLYLVPVYERAEREQKDDEAVYESEQDAIARGVEL